MNQTEFHFIGIGGIGMSALAKILLEKQAKVTGSDAASNEMTNELSQLGASITLGHAKEAIGSSAAVVYSSSIKNENLELIAAKEKKCPLMHRSELLWELAKNHTSLAVAGTHGKTTTSSLLAYCLHHMGADPSYALGGYVPSLSNGKWGRSDYFVLEADESDGTFLNYHPSGAIVTNVEPDHMEHFGTLDCLKGSFMKFIEQVKSRELLFYCFDDPVLQKEKIKGFSYGFKKGADCHIEHFSQNGFEISYDIFFLGKCYEKIRVPLIGRHNALNSAAVFALLLQLGFSEEKIRDAFLAFPSVKRRIEKRGEVCGISFFDDYAHHPTEIKTTLKGLKKALRDRPLIVIFQPHRFTRLSYLMDEFTKAFEIADRLIVTDLYSAGEAPIENVSSEALVEKIRQQGTVPVSFVARKDLASHLAETLYPHDVVITLGAGNLPSLHSQFIETMTKRAKRRYVVGVVFGGRSCEHEISFRSARYVMSSLNPEFYDVKFFCIDKGGGWIAGKRAIEVLENENEISAGSGQSFLSPDIAKEMAACDLFFPVLHGPFGEDGTIQGLFEMLQKPYVGPDFRSSAMAMDKAITKELLLQHGVLTPPFITFSYERWLLEKEQIYQELAEKLKYPFVVKPRHLGSSVAVTEVKSADELEAAVDLAFHFDSDVIIDEKKLNCREIEFPVLGADLDVEVAPPGEKLTGGRVLDWEMKYSKNPAKVTLDPLLEPKILEKGKEMAKRAYLALGIKGMSRVDSLLDPEGNFWFIEINTIPGMTQLSLFPKVWEKEGVTGEQLMNRLILSGMAKFRRIHRHQRVPLV